MRGRRGGRLTPNFATVPLLTDQRAAATVLARRWLPWRR